MARLFLLLLLLVNAPLWAQQLEIIELKSRTVVQVLPALQPLLEPGATLSGSNNQLFLRASPNNRAEIKRALAAIDTPARRLLIEIAHNRQADEGARGAQGSGQVVLGSTRRSTAEARVWDTRSVRSERGGQRIQTIEGGQAFIQIGRSLPIPMRQLVVGRGGAVVNETVVYRDVGQGFYAVPRVNGQRVTLEISQQADSLSAGRGGMIDTQRLTTTVSGQLGEWIELGGGGRHGDASQQGGFSVSTSEVRDQRSIWLRVEEID